VYTSVDYIDIIKHLIKEWQIESINDLNDAGEKARDYLMALPDRLTRIAERMKTPELEYEFSWVKKR
jgi:acyl-[acyl-carrier-protein] desaturase